MTTVIFHSTTAKEILLRLLYLHSTNRFFICFILFCFSFSYFGGPEGGGVFLSSTSSFGFRHVLIHWFDLEVVWGMMWTGRGGIVSVTDPMLRFGFRWRRGGINIYTITGLLLRLGGICWGRDQGGRANTYKLATLPRYCSAWDESLTLSTPTWFQFFASIFS